MTKAIILERATLFKLQSSGHKAFLWSWLDRYDPEDVRLLLYRLDFIQLIKLSSSKDAIIIAAAQPPYNARYPARD